MPPGQVLGEAWRLYRAHWRHLIPIALAVYLLLSLFTFLLTLLLGWLGWLSAVFIRLAGVFWLQGALVVAVEDIRDGRADLSIRETLSRVRPRMNTLAAAGMLAAFAITVGLLLLIVPGLVLATWWILIVPVIMLEGASVGRALGRSRELVRGEGWNVFGLIVLTFLILTVAAFVIGILLRPLEGSIPVLLRDVVSNTLTAPFVALAFTLAYYRLHFGREASPATA
ncbi:MAG: hypothetical protein M3312_04920 [Actinomycetota bacterium]|nr:hypothetical protein [Actinomycetota bacterium]